MFSLSLLTTVAILDGIIQSLVHWHCCESTTESICQQTLGRITDDSLPSPVCTKTTCPTILEQAEKEAQHVLYEIQTLVGVSDVSRVVVPSLHRFTLFLNTETPPNLSALDGAI